MMAALIEKLKSRRKAATKGAGDASRALSELRQMGARLRDLRAEIEARPLPLAEAQDTAARAVMAEAERTLAEINLASLMKPAEGRAPALTLTADQRAALLGAALADHYDRQGFTGIDAADRAAELAKIEADALAAELAEEGIIRELERDGFAPLRRPDADPRALLAHDDELS